MVLDGLSLENDEEHKIKMKICHSIFCTAVEQYNVPEFVDLGSVKVECGRLSHAYIYHLYFLGVTH